MFYKKLFLFVFAYIIALRNLFGLLFSKLFLGFLLKILPVKCKIDIYKVEIVFYVNKTNFDLIINQLINIIKEQTQKKAYTKNEFNPED